ncbi:MAG: histidine triad nucleotide-binding protein [Candidatus Riflebacteria bacterium]|nr:histidine triad nucleotide-binding protein [Candidatus Riflebacteria bacterium]
MNNCIFCKIAKREIPATLVFQNEDVVAFSDISPQAPVHVLVVPTQHIPSLLDKAASEPVLLNKVFTAIQKIAENEKLEEGFRVVINCGENGGQTVGHLHFHVLGKRRMVWPPG